MFLFLWFFESQIGIWLQTRPGWVEKSLKKIEENKRKRPQIHCRSTAEIKIRPPPLRHISPRFWTKVLIFWFFLRIQNFGSYFLGNCSKKNRLRRKNVPSQFSTMSPFLPWMRAKSIQNRFQKFSPAAQNEPLFVLKFLFFGKYFGKVPILLKFSSNLETIGS